ncbi:MAG: class I SAM-dependent methyltransferase [Alphaproteobacteria bacterium]|nr:class I SAM-dependent methyltransferase [Alphaproteobacteria bacterium]
MTGGLEAHLRALIAAEGPISVARFMAEALGHREYGYYRTRDPLGAAGDFITAPEISQIFGELIGAWCATVWQQSGRPDPVNLVELGPGRGTLVADVLRTIGKIAPAFDAAVAVHLVETSPALRAAQASALGARPHWHEAIEDVPQAPTILIANEFFDALPIHQYVRRGRAWHERLVGYDHADAVWRYEVSGAPTEAPLDPPVAEEGDIFETCPAGAAIMRTLAGRLAAHGGGALIIDYGHRASAVGETLQAVRGHKYAPVLEAPGEADLTAHVDFAVLARAAEGVAVFGPITQGAFLEALGIEVRTQALAAAAPDQKRRDDVLSGAARLTDPRQMGSLFKALALIHPQPGHPKLRHSKPAHPNQAPPPGFKASDRHDR